METSVCDGLYTCDGYRHLLTWICGSCEMSVSFSILLLSHLLLNYTFSVYFLLLENEAAALVTDKMEAYHRDHYERLSMLIIKCAS